jgi:hypothetical protein
MEVRPSIHKYDFSLLLYQKVTFWGLTLVMARFEGKFSHQNAEVQGQKESSYLDLPPTLHKKETATDSESSYVSCS